MKSLTMIDVLELPIRTLLQELNDKEITRLYDTSSMFFNDSADYSSDDIEQLLLFYGQFIESIVGHECTEDTYPSTFSFLRTQLKKSNPANYAEALRENTIRLIILSELELGFDG